MEGSSLTPRVAPVEPSARITLSDGTGCFPQDPETRCLLSLLLFSTVLEVLETAIKKGGGGRNRVSKRKKQNTPNSQPHRKTCRRLQDALSARESARQSCRT